MFEQEFTLTEIKTSRKWKGNFNTIKWMHIIVITLLHWKIVSKSTKSPFGNQLCSLIDIVYSGISRSRTKDTNNNIIIARAPLIQQNTLL